MGFFFGGVVSHLCGSQVLGVGLSIVLLSGIGGAFTASVHAQHFNDCLQNVNNATVIVPEGVTASIGDETGFESGDEIALFTDEGNCAGYGTWDGSSLSIAVTGTDDQSSGGYELGESFKYRIWDASAGVEYSADSTDVLYEGCKPGSFLCREDGTYEHDVIFSLAEIDASDPLPAELASFKASLDGPEVLLQWETASETNNAGFAVQHQGPEAAPGAWERLTFVEGHGTTTRAHRYTYRTEALSSGLHKFRLKQIDFDGAFEFSAITEVTLALAGAYELSPVYPNPFTQRTRFTLMVARKQPVQVAVYNVLGQRIALLHDGLLAAGTAHTFGLKGEALPSGKYFIRVLGAAFTATRKVTHVR